MYLYLLLHFVKYINLNTKNECINYYIQISRKYRNIHFIVNEMNNETSYFLFQIISFKKYFYVSLGNNFLLFLWRPP